MTSPMQQKIIEKFKYCFKKLLKNFSEELKKLKKIKTKKNIAKVCFRKFWVWIVLKLIDKLNINTKNK